MRRDLFPTTGSLIRSGRRAAASSTPLPGAAATSEWKKYFPPGSWFHSLSRRYQINSNLRSQESEVLERRRPGACPRERMMRRNLWIAVLVTICLGSVFVALAQKKETETSAPPVTPTAQDLAPFSKIEKSSAEWKSALTPA